MSLMNNNLSELSVTAYDYELPEELVACYPLATRSASRLMHINSEGSITDKKFTELTNLLNAGDLIVFNDTKVMKARLFGQKDTGGKVEILVEKLTNDKQFTQGNSNVALCHVRASKSPKIGQKLLLADDNISCEMIGRHENLFILVFNKPILNDLEQHGELPIPPYFNRRADETDNTRYQTVFNDPEKTASVAAPTASLHFDDYILEQLTAKGVKTAFVTLNVGAGTFAPVKTDNILEHTMHSEYAHLPESTAIAINKTQADGGKVIAVGTTVTRVLESAYLHTALNSEKAAKQQEAKNHKGLLSAWAGDTDIFIYPGYEFKVIDRLITNFHLPKSTLLMLISAFVGKDTVMTAYQHAINEKYRFFSYGDSMILEAPSKNKIKEDML